MKIIDNAPSPTPRQVRDLKSGDLFAYCGYLLLKTDLRDGVNAVNIETGAGCSVQIDWVVDVVYPDAVLYLHGAPKS